MAITRTRGGTLPFVAEGRTLAFYTISAITSLETSSSAVGSDLEKLVIALEFYGTVEMLGTPGTGATGGASGAVRVAISGSYHTAATLQVALRLVSTITNYAAITVTDYVL